MSEKLISVIIPVYNVDKYLNKCIESVALQTYGNLEIIIVDDGSTDSCSDICDKWSGKDSRITVIHQQNKGLCAARNAGLDVCKGEFISFVDSDDYIDTNMIKYLYEAIVDNDCDVAACYECAFENEEIPRITQLSFNKNKIEDHSDFIENFNLDFRGPLTWVWNKLYRRDCIADIRFDEKHNKLEDIIYMVELSKRVTKCVWVPERLYYYRQHSKSVMHDVDTDLFECYLYAVQYEYENLKNEGTAEFQVRHLKKCLSMYRELYVQCKNNKMSELYSKCRGAYNKLYDDNRGSLPFGTDKLKYTLYRLV